MIFVIQGRQHRFLPEQPCRQPLKWVLGSLYFQKLYVFLFSLCFLEVHNRKVSCAKLSIVVKKLLLCTRTARFYQTKVLLARNFRMSCQPRFRGFKYYRHPWTSLLYIRRYPQFQIPSTSPPVGRRESWN